MQTITPALQALLISKFQAADSGFAGRVEVAGVSYRCKRIDLDKSLTNQSDQMSVELTNEEGLLGWGGTSIFPTNSRIKAFQWFGDVANEVQVFDGLIDNPKDHRDIRQLTLTCRDRFALLVDQTFSASAPQGAGEDGAVRTPDNGVYLSMEVSDIITDILDRVGWPTADRAITPSSYVIDEFRIDDGQNYGDAILGSGRLRDLTGYDAWSDELGIFRWAPTPASDIITVEVEPAYTWRSGVDLISLDDSTDQYDLITRTKARGPLTTLKPSWTETWRTTRFAQPVGLWYDPAAPANLRVLDRGTKRLYTLRQSDRHVLSSVYLGGIVGHPLGLSGDPSNADRYWVLDAPWIDGGSGGNRLRKFRKSDNAQVASYVLPDGRWSAVKVSASFIWLTNLDTDRFYKRSKADASAIANYQHVVSGVTQANPSGIMVDGTTLHLFWANGGTTARFVTCDESDPATETGIVKTTGTALHGGEMDTTTHVDCYGDSDSLGLVAKFSLVTPVTTDIAVEIKDGDLEDELGALAELEDRIHDTHPGDAAHPWESRRATLSLDLVTSLAQANDSARFWLEKNGRRRRVVDAGIIGNPAIQKNDLVRVEDPVSGLAQNFVIDTHRSSMTVDGFVGTVALIRGGVANEVITEDPPAIDLPELDVVEIVPLAGSATFTDPVVAGQGLLLVIMGRGLTPDASSRGYTLVTSDANSQGASIWIRGTATGAEGDNIDFATASVQGVWVKFNQPISAEDSDHAIGAGSPTSVGPIVASDGAFVFTGSAYAQGGALDAYGGDMSTTPGAGWTEDYDHKMVEAGGTPVAWVGHQGPVAGGSFTGSSSNAVAAVDAAGGGTTNWAAVIASIVPA